MATYPPPTYTEPLSIFNPVYFESDETTITIDYANKHYLRFPVAQGTETLQQTIHQGTATFNDDVIVNANANFNDEVLITTANGSSATASLNITDSVGSKSVFVLPNTNAGSYNPATDAGSSVILAKGSAIDTATLELSTWSSTNGSVKLTPSSTSMGYGGTSTTSSSYVLCNGSDVVISPSVEYPDGSIQNSAFTGAKALAGSYTLTNMTIDANGKITALSSGSSSSQFQPTFYNNSDYQSTNAYGYSQGNYINFNGSWGNLDYVIIRYTTTGNWNNTGSGFNNYATSTGIITFRPYFMPSGQWAVRNGYGSILNYTTNSGNSNIGANQKAVYTTGAINNGTQSYFYMMGTNKQIQFLFASPETTGGWEYTMCIEYMARSYSGGSVQITNASQGTNNTLP